MMKTMAASPHVLIVDDDPVHLQLYSWILQRGGFAPVTALVRGNGVELPTTPDLDVAVLDYRLGGTLTAVEVASRLRTTYPALPIVILSDLFGMPTDIAPLAKEFVRKGDPKHLLDTLSRLTAH
jgi:CheY-like chemotaxis protein